MKHLVFLKLGGSLITDKTKPSYFIRDNVENVAKQINKALIKKDFSLIIGTGTGSFGHYYAIKYLATEPIKTDLQHKGVCIIHDSVAFLNHLVITALINNNIHAFSVSPSSFISSNKSRITKYNKGIINKFLEKKFIPVLFGDMIIDSKYGAVVMSTEKLLSNLSLLFKKEYESISIIHAGITDGVIDNAGKTVNRINVKNYNKVKRSIFKTQGFDVTGGMNHKLQIGMNLVKNGIKTIILNGLSSDALYKTLMGEQINTSTVIG